MLSVAELEAEVLRVRDSTDAAERDGAACCDAEVQCRHGLADQRPRLRPV